MYVYMDLQNDVYLCNIKCSTPFTFLLLMSEKYRVDIERKTIIPL